MKPVKTPDSNVNLTLPGGTADNDLPAQRILLYDGDAGETVEDARAGFESIWLPDENEARRLEAGAAVRLRIWGNGHPPVSLTVTDAVVPERELIDRGHVDRALGHLYGQLKVEIRDKLARYLMATEAFARVPENTLDDVLPEPAAFADLWVTAVDATNDGRELTAEDASPVDHATPDQNGGPQ